MPDNSQPIIRQGAGSDSTERLNSAIDRMLGGGPVPVLTDPELNDLLNLATRLRGRTLTTISRSDVPGTLLKTN